MALGRVEESTPHVPTLLPGRENGTGFDRDAVQLQLFTRRIRNHLPDLEEIGRRVVNGPILRAQAQVAQLKVPTLQEVLDA